MFHTYERKEYARYYRLAKGTTFQDISIVEPESQEAEDTPVVLEARDR